MTLAVRDVDPAGVADHATPVVLIIGDDRRTRDGLATSLAVEGFEIRTADTAAEGIALAEAGVPALVLLDAEVGGGSGFTVFRRLTEAAPWLPVIMLTEEGDELDAVLALEAGAADHVTKPARPRELTARIRAVLRRVGAQPRDTVRPAHVGAVTFGPVTVDVDRREATLHGRALDLSRKEFDLLALLVTEGGHVVTRQQCMDRIWRDRKKGDSRTLDTHVKRLRKKVERVPAEPDHILTIRGVGYRFKP